MGDPSADRLDAVAVQVVAYAKQERESALEAARLHVEALESERVPRFALRYSNYLSPTAKRRLLEQLEPGVNKATEIWSTARTSLTDALAPHADVLPAAGDLSKKFSNFPSYAKAGAVILAAIFALFLLKSIFDVVAWAFLAIGSIGVVGLVTTRGYVKGELEKRAHVVVTNEVALEAASQGSKSAVKDRLQLTLLRHGVQTGGEVVDELWDILSPPKGQRAG